MYQMSSREGKQPQRGRRAVVLRRRGTARRTLALLALHLTLISGCGGPSPQLAALQAEPMTSWQPAEGRLAFRSEAGQRRTLGKPEQAQVLRVFALPDRSAADAALADGVAEAEQSGWSVADPATVSAGTIVSATKQLETGSAELAVTLIENPDQAPDGVDVPALSIRLVHRYSD